MIPTTKLSKWLDGGIPKLHPSFKAIFSMIRVINNHAEREVFSSCECLFEICGRLYRY